MDMFRISDSMMGGANVARMLIEADMAQRAQQLAEIRSMEDRQLKDAQFQLEMNQMGARPVQDGMVKVKGRELGGVADNPAILGSSALRDAEFTRRPEGGTVRRKMSDGSTVEFELPSIDEQAKRTRDMKTAERRALEEVDTEATRQRGMNAAAVAHDARQQYGTPASGGLLEAFPFLSGVNLMPNEMIQAGMGASRIQSTAANQAANRQAQMDRATLNATLAQWREKFRAGNRVETEGMKEAGRNARFQTGRGDLQRERFTASQLRTLEDDERALQKAEDGLHQEALQIGAALKNGAQTKSGTMRLSGSQAATAKEKLAAIKQRIASIQGQKQQVVANKNAIMGQSRGAAPAGGPRGKVDLSAFER